MCASSFENRIHMWVVDAHVCFKCTHVRLPFSQQCLVSFKFLQCPSQYATPILNEMQGIDYIQRKLLCCFCGEWTGEWYSHACACARTHAYFNVTTLETLSQEISDFVLLQKQGAALPQKRRPAVCVQTCVDVCNCEHTEIKVEK